VSGGEWFEWVYQILPFVTQQEMILEIGFGTGKLINKISNRGKKIFGIDESQSMIKITKNRFTTTQHSPIITRGDSSSLPFRNDSFDLILTTFPSEFVFSEKFHQELIRVLRSPGKFIALIAVSYNKRSFIDIFYRFIYMLTKQSFSIDSLEQKLSTIPWFGNIKHEITTIEYKGRQLFFLTIEKF